MGLSRIEALVAAKGAAAVAAEIEAFPKKEREAFQYHWEWWARPEQLPPPGDWRTWYIQTGRGWGKTRTAAEWVKRMAEAHPGCRIALVGRTAADVRDVMIEGESGLLACYPEAQRPSYEPSKRRVTFKNGSVATAYGAKEPGLLRGPQHHFGWADELAAWFREAPNTAKEAWDNLKLGMRLGKHPRIVVTTTPKPLPLLKEIRDAGKTVVTRGSTLDNRSNLAPSFFEEIIETYRNTHLWDQEVLGKYRDDDPNALWNRLRDIEPYRANKPPELTSIAVGVDPQGTKKDENHTTHTGIVVVGIAEDDEIYVLDDSSIRGKPNEWGRAVVAAYHRLQAEMVVAEVNQGGDMVVHVIRTVDEFVPVETVRASRGKRTRAEPVSALAQQGKIHHVGTFPDLEDELCSWVPGEGESPDRLDALVWAVTYLMVGGGGSPNVWHLG